MCLSATTDIRAICCIIYNIFISANEITYKWDILETRCCIVGLQTGMLIN